MNYKYLAGHVQKVIRPDDGREYFACTRHTTLESAKEALLKEIDADIAKAEERLAHMRKTRESVESYTPERVMRNAGNYDRADDRNHYI
ncbi:TPA: hypothetical protein ACTW9J_000366 [Klebsiella michiganensis]|nr:hypothetical protein [Klebsiella michiganensis]ELC2232993.1 hypothetical protein [Klebsiella michiganensis]